MLLELPVLPQRSFVMYYFWNKKERKINFFHDLILIKWFFSQFSSVQLLNHVRLPETPWIAALQASLSITNSRSSLRLTSIESVMPSSRLILCRLLLLLPPIPPNIRVFSNESTLLMRWPKYWSFSFSIIPSKEHPRLISFRMDWLDLLAVQGTLKSLLQLVLSNTYHELGASLVAQMIKNHVLVTVIRPKNIEVNNNNNRSCLYEIYFDWETIKRKVKKNSKW